MAARNAVREELNCFGVSVRAAFTCLFQVLPQRYFSKTAKTSAIQKFGIKNLIATSGEELVSKVVARARKFALAVDFGAK